MFPFNQNAYTQGRQESGGNIKFFANRLRSGKFSPGAGGFRGFNDPASSHTDEGKIVTEAIAAVFFKNTILFMRKPPNNQYIRFYSPYSPIWLNNIREA